jgi:hypothetical protein
MFKNAACHCFENKFVPNAIKIRVPANEQNYNNEIKDTYSWQEQFTICLSAKRIL